MKTYFTGKFMGRRPIVFFVGFVMSAIGGVFVYSFVSSFLTTRTLPLFPVLCTSLFIVMFLGFGLFLLSRYILNTTTVLRIDTAGISYGQFTAPWSDVVEFGVMKKYLRRRDLYCRTRNSCSITELLLSRGLSDTEIETLFATLLEEVVPDYRGIELVIHE